MDQQITAVIVNRRENKLKVIATTRVSFMDDTFGIMIMKMMRPNDDNDDVDDSDNDDVDDDDDGYDGDDAAGERDDDNDNDGKNSNDDDDIAVDGNC